MGQEGQLHYTIIQSKTGNEVPVLISSNLERRRRGERSEEGGEEAVERQNGSKMTSGELFRMIVARVAQRRLLV